jgi:ribose transport system substrate-binding protein
MFTGPSNTMANHPLHDTTSICWQIVLVGGRKAGKDLNVKVPELGAHSESDINGQISILENAVSEKPAAIVISPTQKAASASG